MSIYYVLTEGSTSDRHKVACNPAASRDLDGMKSQPQASLPTLALTGPVCLWGYERLDMDALVRPLGLSGQYTVLGIDNVEKEKQLPTFSRTRRQVQGFKITCTPGMTAIHLLQLAAREDIRRNGHRDEGHIFFECISIRGRVIEFGMGS